MNRKKEKIEGLLPVPKNFSKWDRPNFKLPKPTPFKEGRDIDFFDIEIGGIIPVEEGFEYKINAVYFEDELVEILKLSKEILPNPNYEEEMVLYNKAKAAYNEELVEYKKNLKNFKHNQKLIKEHEEKKLLAKLKDKYEKTGN